MGWESDHSLDNVHSGFDLTGQIVTAVLAVIFIVLVFFVCLYCWARRSLQASVGPSLPLRVSAGRRGRSVFGGAQTPGLEKSVIESLPVFVYQRANHTDRLECAVCLCEFEEKEKGRLLPNCKHTFHLDCIDLWFHSHSTCPLCRSPARPAAPSAVAVVGRPSGAQTEAEAPAPVAAAGSLGEPQPGGTTGPSDGLPADGLSRGAPNLDRMGCRCGSSSHDPGTPPPKASVREIVIDIPARRADAFPSPRLFTGDAQQASSPGARLRSLQRLLSRDKKAFPQSPHGLHLQQDGQAHT